MQNRGSKAAQSMNELMTSQPHEGELTPTLRHWTPRSQRLGRNTWKNRVPKKHNRFLRGRQIACVWVFPDHVKVTLRAKDVLGFNTKWDEL